MPDTVVVRYSLLVRNARHTPEEFRRHYLEHHGPLALAQAGFRRFTLEYVQNHCIRRLAGSELQLDGISATTQLPREDYRIGFFQEPDYAMVQPDEEYLFDVSRVCSVLAEREPAEGAGGAFKGFALARDAAADELLAAVAPARHRISRIDVSTASRLGFGGSTFEYDTVVEFWNDEPAAELARDDERIQAWAIDEHIMLPLNGDPTA